MGEDCRWCGSPSSPTAASGARPRDPDALAAALRGGGAEVEVRSTSTRLRRRGAAPCRRARSALVVAGGDGSDRPPRRSAARAGRPAGRRRRRAPRTTSPARSACPLDLEAALRAGRATRTRPTATSSCASPATGRSSTPPAPGCPSPPRTARRPLKSRLGPLAYARRRAARRRSPPGPLRCAVRADGERAVRGRGVAGHRRRDRRVRRRQPSSAAPTTATAARRRASSRAGSRVGARALRAWGMRRGTLDRAARRPAPRGATRDRASTAGRTFNVDGEICELRPPRLHARAPGGVRVVVRAMNRRWPAAIAAVGVAWYASESLRHRREQGDGYTLAARRSRSARRSSCAPPRRSRGAPITEGNDAELLVNGDADLPRLPRDDAGSAESTMNFLTYVYWRGDIAARGRRGAGRARARRASRSTCCSTPSATREDGARAARRAARRGRHRRAASARPGPTRCGG